MKITDLLDRSSVELNGKPATKSEAIDQMVELMTNSGKINDKEAYKAKVFAREKEGTTAVGEGIAIPHAKGDSVNKPGLAAMVIRNGVDFESFDGEPVKLIFLIAAPDTKENIHLDVLAKLSVLMMDETFVGDLINAQTLDEFFRIINEGDVRMAQNEIINPPSEEKKFKIVAVTGCPTGIAHTYMAAENLDKKAKAKNCDIKVETRGAGGTKNLLTAAEIAEADCVIIASDTKVPMDRFNGKKVIQTQVSDGINKAEQLVVRAISGDVPIFNSGNEAKTTTSTKADGSTWHKIYTHLMNGISHMLPFVVGGGILIAIAFLIDGFSIDINSLTADERGNFGKITESAALFMKLGGTAFGLMLPVLAGFIAMSIADRPGLALGFVGGALAAAGKSGFLGALVAGFVAGFIIILLKKLFAKLPKVFDGIKPILLYPLFGILGIGLIMVFVVEPPVGYLNTLMNDALTGLKGTNSIILGIIIAGMMSVDLGGPVNKAAYVFGVASIAAGNYTIMAAVMVGGMVPPCVIALSTLLFKKKFTSEERKSGPANFIMGLSFISEGAIPYAAADPLRVLPSCIVGSAVAGALSMAFNCSLMAPHGGIFVFPVVGNALLYLVALAVGTIVGAIMLGILKKAVTE